MLASKNSVVCIFAHSGDIRYTDPLPEKWNVFWNSTFSFLSKLNYFFFLEKNEIRFNNLFFVRVATKSNFLPLFNVRDVAFAIWPTIIMKSRVYFIFTSTQLFIITNFCLRLAFLADVSRSIRLTLFSGRKWQKVVQFSWIFHAILSDAQCEFLIAIYGHP